MIDRNRCGGSDRQIDLFQLLRDISKHRSYVTGADGGDAQDNKLQRTDNALSNHHTLFLHFIYCEINGIIYRLKHPAHREAL